MLLTLENSAKPLICNVSAIESMLASWCSYTFTSPLYINVTRAQRSVNSTPGKTITGWWLEPNS